MDKKSLPKPELDLPLPEKEIPASSDPSDQKPNILKSKFLWGFLAVSFLAAFLIGGFTLGKNQSNKAISPAPTKQADETATWKTYTDIYYGGLFSIKYPPAWKARPDDLNKYIFFESPDYKGNLGEGMIINISVSDTKQNDIEQWFSDYRSHAKGPESTRIFEETLKRIRVGGVPALQYDISLQARETTTSFIKNNKLFHISSLWPNANLIDNKQIMDAQTKTYNQILSTFKFTNNSPVHGDPADETITNAPTIAPKGKEQVYCTDDVKLCPDGSYVGRSGPNCEFAPCPNLNQ